MLFQHVNIKYFVFFAYDDFILALWYYNIDKLSLLAYKVTQLGGTEEVKFSYFE